MVIEGKISKESIDAVKKNIIENDHFPWYWLDKPVTKKHPGMHHTLIPRYNYDTNEGYRINSPYHDLFNKIFSDFCKTKKIKIKRILRSQLNLTWSFKAEYSEPHIDHEFKHSICIIYLNPFSKGSTYLFKENKMVKEIKAEEGKIVVFPGIKHATGFCKEENERRIICIISFEKQ